MTLTRPGVPGCDGGEAKFVDGSASMPDVDHGIGLSMELLNTVPYHDFDGDGVAEALISVHCSNGAAVGERLWAVTPTGAATGRLLDIVTSVHADINERIESYSVDGGVVSVTI